MLSDLQKKAIESACGGASHADDKSISEAVAGVVAVQAVAQIATADATDLASAEALANACKAKINEILAAVNAG